MSNENNGLTPNQQKELDTVKWKIDFQNKVMEELRSNEAIRNYFRDFTPESVGQFIEHYAIQKSNWHQHGPLWVKVKDEQDLKWTEAGWWHLELIQQKKLFNIQCLWRAEQIELKEIELACDFNYWERNILNCPFIEPVTPGEVEMYLQYLGSGDVQLKEDMDFLLSFQNHRAIKDAYTNENSDYEVPLWYEFYDTRKGTASLVELPDIRGKKEQFYVDLARSPEQKQAIAELSKVFHQNAGEYTDKNGRKILNVFSDETLDFFVEAFEDKQTREFYKACAWAHKDDEETEQLEDDIKFLLSSPTPVAVEENIDWREAIREAARRYSIELIAEHLREAYQQYRMNLSMNIAFPEGNTDHVKAAKEVLVKDILLGRKMNGEPEDLNF